MAGNSVRAHVFLSREILKAVDELVGERRRSEFVEQALAEKLARERLAEALKDATGSLDVGDYPEWSSPDKVSAWVRELRTKARR